MQRRLLIPIIAVVVLALAGAAGAYAYFFSGLRTSPAPLALASPSAAASASASPTATASATTGAAYAGTWQIGSGSIAGYRVKEQFVGQTSAHEAVARTSAVTGQLTIAQSGGTYQLTAAAITVQLGGLASVDQVAGYNVTNRDRLVQNALEVSQFPTAVFQAQAVTIPDSAQTGQAVSISVPGQLTIHGVTKTVTAIVQLKVGGSTAQAAGSISINMNDYGVNAPNAPFTTVQQAVTIEFQVNLTKTA